MGKALKIILVIVFLLVLLMLTITLVLPLVIDPNDFKTDIERIVEDNTGRALRINGDLELSFFPWLGISTGKLALHNTPGFSDKPFIEIGQSQIKVRLIPLLSKQLEVKRMVLKGLVLNLEKNKQGLANWQGLNATGDKDRAITDSALAAFSIGGISLADARINWDDRQSGKHKEIKKINLDTERVEFNRPVNINLAFSYIDDQAGLVEEIAFTGALIVNETLDKVNLRNISLEATTISKSVPEGRLTVNLAADMELNPNEANGSADIKNIVINVDETIITGEVQINDYQQPAIRFKLVADHIDMDRYLPPTVEKVAGRETVKKTKKPVTPATALTAGVNSFPVDGLKSLDAQGTLLIDEVIFNNLRLQSVSLKLTAKDGIVQTRQLVEQLYQGGYSGNLNFDVTGKLPQFSLNERISNVRLEPLLNDLRGSAPMSGIVNASVKLHGAGNSGVAIKSSLRGEMDFKFNDGVIKGFNLYRIIQEGKALFKKIKIPSAAVIKNETEYAEITAHANIENGLVRNNDLFARSSLLQVNGAGSADLKTGRLDYKVTAKVINKAATVTEAVTIEGIPVIIDIRGTFDKPVYALNLKEMIGREKKQKILDKVEKKYAKDVRKLLQKLF